MAELYITPSGGGSGDVVGPATNTDSYIPQWNGANSKTLKDGLVVPSGGLAGLTALADKAPIANPTFTGTPATPTAGAGDSTTQIASTAFVQQAVRSVPSKEASEYATIAALPTVVYNNGTAGVGATLTGVAMGAIGIDSGSPSVGQRILVKNQVSTFENGIYTVTATGSGIAVFVLTRALDFNQTGDIVTGASTYVVSGTTLSGTTWDVNSADNPTMGSGAITFVQVSGPGSIIAGTGIGISGVTVAIDTTVTADLTSTQTMTGKTIDGVTPTVMGYVDPTSSIQTQLNGKQASGAYLTTVDISANTNLAVSAPIVLTGDTLSIPAATASVNGYATSTQITKLDGIATSATANTKATGAEVNTGTDDVKFVTAKAVIDSKISITDHTETLTNKTLTAPLFQGSIDGWTSANETWAYASASTITVPSGAASKYQVGDKIKYTAGGVVHYHYITIITDTLLTTVGDAVHNDTMTANNYSHQQSPLGFPQYFAYALTYAGFSANPTASAIFSINGVTCHVIYYTVGAGTSNASTMSYSLPTKAWTSAGYETRGYAIVSDAGTLSEGSYYIASAATTVAFFKAGLGGFTSSGNKFAVGQFDYRIA